MNKYQGLENRGGIRILGRDIDLKTAAITLLALTTTLAACAPAGTPSSRTEPGVTPAPKPATALVVPETQKQVEQSNELRVKVSHLDAQGGISPLISEKRINIAIWGGTSPEPENAEALTPENLQSGATAAVDKKSAEIKIAEIKTSLEQQLAALAQNEKIMPVGYTNALVVSQAFTFSSGENKEIPWVGAALVDQNGKIVAANWQPLDGAPIGPGNVNGRTITADGELFWADTYGTFVRAKPQAIGEDLTGKMLLQLPTYSFDSQNNIWLVSRTEPMVVTKMFDQKTGVEGTPPGK